HVHAWLGGTLRLTLFRTGDRRAHGWAVVPAHQVAVEELGVFGGLGGMVHRDPLDRLGHQTALWFVGRFRSIRRLAAPRLPAAHDHRRYHQPNDRLFFAADVREGLAALVVIATGWGGDRLFRRRDRRNDGHRRSAAGHHRPPAVHSMGLDVRCHDPHWHYRRRAQSGRPATAGVSDRG